MNLVTGGRVGFWLNRKHFIREICPKQWLWPSINHTLELFLISTMSTASTSLSRLLLGCKNVPQSWRAPIYICRSPARQSQWHILNTAYSVWQRTYICHFCCVSFWQAGITFQSAAYDWGETYCMFSRAIAPWWKTMTSEHVAMTKLEE